MRKIYEVTGFAAGTRLVYGKAETPEGAAMLAEEAARVSGWKDVRVEEVYEWTC